MQLERAAREVHQGKRDLEDALTETQVGAGRSGCQPGCGHRCAAPGRSMQAYCGHWAGHAPRPCMRSCAGRLTAADLPMCPTSLLPCRRPRASWARRPRTSAACTLSAPSC